MAKFDEETIDDDVETEDVDDDTQKGDEGDESGDVADRLKAVEQNQALNALMADPEVQEVIRLKRAGKPVAVSEKADKEEETADEEDAIDDDDPAKEVLHRFAKIIDKKLSPISERLSSIEGLADDVRRQGVDSQVKTLREAHEDFDKYRDQMMVLAKDNTGLDVEELYMLARKRAGKLDLTTASTFSEKPTTQTVHRKGIKRVAKASGRQRGRQGFQKILAKALDVLELDME